MTKNDANLFGQSDFLIHEPLIWSEVVSPEKSQICRWLNAFIY